MRKFVGSLERNGRYFRQLFLYLTGLKELWNYLILKLELLSETIYLLALKVNTPDSFTVRKVG